MNDTIILTPGLMEAFRAHLRGEEKSPYTIEKYIRDASAFMRFAQGRPLSRDLTISFKNHLIQKTYGGASINSMLASVNSLLRFLGTPQYRADNLRLQKQLYRREERSLGRDEYLRLRDAARGRQRLCLILETLCGTGIRISELSYFNVESLRKGEVEVRCKGKTRTVIVPRELCGKLLRYAKEKNISSGAVFCTRSGNPVNRSNVWAEMKSLCERAGVARSKVFPHNLRKLFARMYYRMSGDIAQLADILGHSSINTTRIYVMATGQEVRGRVEKLGRLLCGRKMEGWKSGRDTDSIPAGEMHGRGMCTETDLEKSGRGTNSASDEEMPGRGAGTKKNHIIGIM